MFRFFDFLKSKTFKDVNEEITNSLDHLKNESLNLEIDVIQSSGSVPDAIKNIHYQEGSGITPWVLEEKEKERLEWVPNHSE